MDGWIYRQKDKFSYRKDTQLAELVYEWFDLSLCTVKSAINEKKALHRIRYLYFYHPFSIFDINILI